MSSSALDASTRIELIAKEIGAGYRELDVTRSRPACTRSSPLRKEQYGRIDVLVNNAGVMPLSLLAATCKIDEWNQMIDVNLRGVLHGIAAVLPIMRDAGHRAHREHRVASRDSGSTRPRRSTARPSSPYGLCRRGCARRAAISGSRWSAPV